MRRLLSIPLMIMVAVDSGCSRSTDPGDDSAPATITLAQLSIPILAASDDRLVTLNNIDSTARVLTARSLKGDEKWTATVAPCPTDFRCAIALDAAGHIYINTNGGLVSRSGSDGRLRWVASSIQTPAIAVGTGARVYAISRPAVSTQLIHSIDSNSGVIVWSSILPPGFDATAILLDEARSNVYAIGRGGLTILNTQTGAIKSITTQNCATGSDGALVSDGTIYVTCDIAGASRLYAYDQSGTLMWQTSLGTGQGTLSPVIDANGIIYVANSSSLTALNKNGTVAWKLSGLFRNQASPVIDAANNLYISASRISNVSGRYLFRVSNGQILDYVGLFPCAGSLLLTTSGRLYCAEVGVVVHTSTSGNDALAQWSQTGHDSGRTSRK